ncbi:hypothetical protein [Lactiplantibacillus daowaiensis]|uniref:Uncharacterized protein n=1 Tax=Lactiplantibacillus daowaiensis TaxID=2559918 RepID=A0ABW1S0I0_9LACO|nr:hypothetical protein [Lactiplantibacillus daowaiensis]
MTQIVPALPIARVRYERWYQLGLSAVLAASTALTADHVASLTSCFPRFTVFCTVQHGDQQAAAIKQAAATLAVVPNEVDISQQQIALTFGLNWLQAGRPVWQPSAGAIFRLYDGLLTNLLKSAFQPVTKIMVTITDLAQVTTAPTTSPIRIWPNFKQYGVNLAAGGLMSVVQAPALQWQTGQNGTMVAQGYADDEEEELLDQPACTQLKKAIIIPFPK